MLNVLTMDNTGLPRTYKKSCPEDGVTAPLQPTCPLPGSSAHQLQFAPMYHHTCCSEPGESFVSGEPPKLQVASPQSESRALSFRLGLNTQTSNDIIPRPPGNLGPANWRCSLPMLSWQHHRGRRPGKSQQVPKFLNVLCLVIN